MHERHIPSFCGEFIRFTLFKQVPKYLTTGLKRPSGTYSPAAEASTQGLKCKIRTIHILKQQLRISNQELLDNLKSNDFSKIDTIKTYHFSTLYTTISHDKLRYLLFQIMHNCFEHIWHPEIQISCYWETI
jgi:hypothetical protein